MQVLTFFKGLNTSSKFQGWVKEEQANTGPPTLANYIQSILSRKAQVGNSGYSPSLYHLKDAAKMLNFLQQNQIKDMAGVDEKYTSMIRAQMDIQGGLKAVGRRLDTLKKHIRQFDIDFRYKGGKKLTETDETMFTAVKNHLKGVMNGKAAIPTKDGNAKQKNLETHQPIMTRH